MLVSINGVELSNPAPAPPYNFSKKEQDLDSGRNLNGVMERNILAHHPHTLTLKFPPMEGGQMTALLQLLDHSTLNVTAFDPFSGSMQTYVMYHGDLSPSVNIYTPPDRILYNEFTVELVEY